ncbi:hypothetical protein C6P44_004521 [Monosporozyma unispora]|nr:hypothetical protein C6P44_004521 [Kazachstania unispora]
MSLDPTSPIANDATSHETPHPVSPAAFMSKAINNSTPTIISSGSTNILNAIDSTQPSPTREYMTLTPVKLKSLESPLKNSCLHKSESQFSQSPLRVMSPTAKLYKDKFNMISKDLEKLLDSLNVIYKKIGYSTSEMKTNEKLIFTTLSDNIKEFYMKAEEQMKKLSLDNEIEQQVLNAMLKKLNDPNGLNTILDLYTRNAILLPQNRIVPDSPKKPLSLLEVQKSLNNAKKYVIRTYLVQLTRFLYENIKLQKLFKTIGVIIIDLPQEDQEILKRLPSLEISEKFLSLFQNKNEDLKSLSNKIKENKKILLFSDNFESIDVKRISQITQISKIYKQEYEFRVNNLIKKIRKMNDILNELDIDMNSELSPSMQQIFHNYLQLNQNDNNVTFMSVTEDVILTMDSELNKITNMKQDRVNKKNHLLNQCQVLWTKLNQPQSHIDSIMRDNQGFSMKVIDNLTNELGNLEILKKKLIKQLISDSWNKINEHWTTLQVDDNDKQEFISNYERMSSISNSLQDDEELLEYCESETKKLDAKLAIYAPVLKLIKDFQNLLKDKEFLAQSSKDSSRLLSRNSHKILLNEERARKRITRHFPKIISELKDKLDDAQEIFHKPFVLNGRNLFDLIEEEEAEFINKYPRSVLSMNRSRKSSESFNNSNNNNNNKHRETESVRSPGMNNFSTFGNTQRNDSKYKIHKPKTPNHNLQNPISERMSRQGSNLRTTDRTTPLVNRSISIGKPNTIQRSRSTEIKKTNIPHYMMATRSISPDKQRSKLLSPTVIPHKPMNILRERNLSNTDNNNNSNNNQLTSRPFLQRSKSINSPSMGYEKENVAPNTNNINVKSIHGIKPTRLFPVQPKTTLHKSNIPILFKSKSTLSGMDNTTKNNTAVRQMSEMIPPSYNQQPQEVPPQRSYSFPIKEQNGNVLSSPFRESNHSIYQLSMSPEGKFQLNIQQENSNDNNRNGISNETYLPNGNDVFDDTSILEDDETDTNFMQWKREQLIKLDTLKQRQQEQRTLSTPQS